MFRALLFAPRRPKRLALLLWLWLLLPLAVAARPSPRYWNAPPDSLRRVLAGQRADTARLRTLRHLLDVAGPSVDLAAEAAALSQRLHRPEYPAYRAILAAGKASSPAIGLDSLKAAIVVFDRLGRPIPNLLMALRPYYNALNRQEARRAYYAAHLARDKQRGIIENMAACYHGLGGYYVYRGDNNAALGCYMRSIELYRAFSLQSYYNGVGVIGGTYAAWGNDAKALPYLREALSYRRGVGAAGYPYRNLALVYQHQRRYAAALQVLDQSLAEAARDTLLLDRALSSVQKAAVLLELHRDAEAVPLLRTAQRLSDSLQLAIANTNTNFELDATWARYYAARGQTAQAEAAWLRAYAKARASRITLLRLKYLQALARFYQGQGQPAPAARYALAAVALADTLKAAENAQHVARYEIERDGRRQQARISRLGLAQQQAAARVRRQRWLLAGTLLVLGLLACLGVVLWRGNRHQRQANALLSAQKAEVQAQRDQTAQALTELRATQAQLIQKEKMASLGELTAGIAHEIQNPLNFVNNFAEVSQELVVELQEALAASNTAEATELADDVRQNLSKITAHGKRAAGIVRGMLEHSRQSTGERAPTNVNALVEEYLRLAYQGLRAKDKTFNATLETDWAPDLPPVPAVGADLGRVLLNLLGNAFYAVQKRQQTGGAGYQPTVSVRTQLVGSQVHIRVADNGTGIPAEVQAKIFQPFFTTKPTGEGTGLGLSLSHDIVVQGHGGTLSVQSHEGRGTEFLIGLPA